MAVWAKYCWNGENSHGACSLKSSRAFIESYPVGTYTCMSVLPESQKVVMRNFHLTRLGQGLVFEITRESNTMTKESNTMTKESNTMTKESNTITRESNTITKESNTIEENQKNLLLKETRNLTNRIIDFISKFFYDTTDQPDKMCLISILYTRKHQNLPSFSWENMEPFCIVAHACPMPEVNGEIGCAVQVAGHPRLDPLIKHSQWIQDRKELEACKSKDVVEMILRDANGNLLEGLISNFFVVMNGMLYSSEKDVLHGSMREMIFKICQTIGIPVRREAPNLANLEQWEEAFLTNATKKIQNVFIIRYDVDGKQYQHHIGGRTAGVIAQLRCLLDDELVKSAT